MDFQCPHCANRLSIPDQYAGTLMKCPICSKTFQAPNLGPQLPPNVPAAPPPVPAANEGYKLTPEPPRPTSPPPHTEAVQTKAPSPPSGSTDYTAGFAAALDARVVPWIAPACLLLVFVLLWFPWVGQYYPVPGFTGLFGSPYGVNSQTGWGTMFGSSTVDPLWADMTGYKPPTDFSLANVFMVFFFLVLLAAIPLSIAAAVLPHLQISLPPQVEPLKPWRWAAVGGVILLALLVLTLQLVMHFSLETHVREEITQREEFKGKLEGDQLTKEKLRYAAEITKAGLLRRDYLRLTWYLCLVAVLASGLQLWLDRRSPGAPPPRFDLRW